MAVFVCGLLLYANGVAFNLISAPTYIVDIIAFLALAVAVGLTVVTLAIVIRDKRRILSARTQKSNVDSVVKLDQPSNTLSSPTVSAVKESGEPLETGQEQLPKKPVIRPTKVICPACRKEFNLPSYERDYIVDFGRPKRTNLIKQCPHCKTSITLKRKGAFEDEDIWKD